MSGPAAPERVFRALGDPHRLAIIERLGRGDASVSELAAARGMSVPGMTKHLTVLEACGVVNRRKAGRVVNCSLVTAPLHRAERWLHDRTAFWNASLDRLATLVDDPDTPTRTEKS